MEQPQEDGPVASRNIWGPLDSTQASIKATIQTAREHAPYDDKCGAGPQAVLSERYAHLMQPVGTVARKAPGQLCPSYSTKLLQHDDEPWMRPYERGLWAPPDNAASLMRPQSHQFPRVSPFNVHTSGIALSCSSLGSDTYDRFAQFSEATHDFRSEELKHEYKLYNEFKRDRLKQKQRRECQEKEPEELFDVGANISDEERRTIETYFSQDPHGRVKTTASVLNRRFARERERFEKCKLLEKVGTASAGKQQFVLVGFKAGRLDVFSLGERPRERLEIGSYVMVKADRGKDLGRVVDTGFSLSKARFLKVLQLMELHMAFSDVCVDTVPVQEFIQRNSTTVTEAWDTITKTTKPSGGPEKMDKSRDIKLERYSECRNTQGPKFVVSLARVEDVRQIINKRQDEDRVCRSLLAKGHLKDDRHVREGQVREGQAREGQAREGHARDGNRMASMQNIDIELIDTEYQFDRKKLIIYYYSTRRIDFRDLVRDLFRAYKTRIWMSAVARPSSRCRSKKPGPRLDSPQKQKELQRQGPELPRVNASPRQPALNAPTQPNKPNIKPQPD